MKTNILFFFLAILILQSCKKVEPPTASFTYEIDASDPLTVHFTNKSEGEIDAYTWHFGDGAVSIEESPSHTYSVAGTYTVSLKVDNKAGSDTHIQNIYLQGAQSEPPAPDFTDGDAVLVAANIAAWQSGLKVTLASAVAVFKVNGSNVDVGTVKVNNNTLTKNDDNSYYWSPSNSTSFNNDVNWFISGGNGFSITDTTITTGFPSVDKINSSATVNISSGYTLSTSSVTGADSVLFVISGPDGVVERMQSGNATSYTFSSSDLSSVGTGSGVVMIAPFKVVKTLKDNKNWYYINEEVATQNVTINN